MAKIIVYSICVFGLLFCNYLPAQPTAECVIKAATSQLGVSEATGRNDGREVAIYLATYKLPQGYAWCAAYVNWSFLQCGVKTATNAMAASWFPRSKIIFIRNDKKRDYGGWKPGDAFGLRYTINGVTAIRHVGIILKLEGNWVTTIEGNTNHTGSRDGGQVLKRKRHIRGIYAVSRWL